MANRDRLTQNLRFEALISFEKRLIDAQTAYHDLDERDRGRLHLSGVHLYDVLGEMRDACDTVRAGLRGVTASEEA